MKANQTWNGHEYAIWHVCVCIDCGDKYRNPKMCFARRCPDCRIARRKYVNKVQRKTKKAIKAGVLVPQPCQECGVEPAEPHHLDYENHLEVMWLCRSHHATWHNLNRPTFEPIGSIYIPDKDQR